VVIAAIDHRSLGVPPRWYALQWSLWISTPLTLFLTQGSRVLLRVARAAGAGSSSGGLSEKFTADTEGGALISPPLWMFTVCVVLVVASLILLYVGPLGGPLRSHPWLLALAWAISAVLLLQHATTSAATPAQFTGFVLHSAALIVCAAFAFFTALFRSSYVQARKRRGASAYEVNIDREGTS